MTNEEAIKLLKVIDKVIDDCPSQFEDEEKGYTLNDFGNAIIMAVEAFKKVETLEAENARIIELAKDAKHYWMQSNAKGNSLVEVVGDILDEILAEESEE